MAVAKPFYYKKIAQKRNIIGAITSILFLSLSLSLTAQLTGLVSARYIAPPNFTGCATVHRDAFSLFYGLIFVLSLTVDVILITTYFFLNKHLKKVITTSAEIETLKQGALFVTSLTSASFVIGYLPTIIVYVIYTADSDLLTEITSPYLMCLDYSVRLIFHLNSCAIPLVLVSTKTLTTMKTAAKVSRNRSVRINGVRRATSKRLGVNRGDEVMVNTSF